jgi:hypothetical protein
MVLCARVLRKGAASLQRLVYGLGFSLGFMAVFACVLGRGAASPQLSVKGLGFSLG